MNLYVLLILIKLHILFLHLLISNYKDLLLSLISQHLEYQNWIQNEVKNVVGTVESEDELMSVVSLQLAESINNMIENEIAKNLEIIRNNVSEKLKQTSTLLKEMIDASCNYELEINDRMSQSIKSIMEAVEVLRKKQEFSEKQQLFTEV